MSEIKVIHYQLKQQRRKTKHSTSSFSLSVFLLKVAADCFTCFGNRFELCATILIKAWSAELWLTFCSVQCACHVSLKGKEEPTIPVVRGFDYRPCHQDGWEVIFKFFYFPLKAVRYVSLIRGFVFFRRIFRDQNFVGGSFAGAERRFRIVDGSRRRRLRRQQRDLASRRRRLAKKRFSGFSLNTFTSGRYFTLAGMFLPNIRVKWLTIVP